MCCGSPTNAPGKATSSPREDDFESDDELDNLTQVVLTIKQRAVDVVAIHERLLLLLSDKRSPSVPHFVPLLRRAGGDGGCLPILPWITRGVHSMAQPLRYFETADSRMKQRKKKQKATIKMAHRAAIRFFSIGNPPFFHFLSSTKEHALESPILERFSKRYKKKYQL